MPTVYDSGISMPSPATATTISVTMKGHGSGFDSGCVQWLGYSYFQTQAGTTPHVDQSNQDHFNFFDSITMNSDDNTANRQAFVNIQATLNCPFSFGLLGGGAYFFTTSAMLATSQAPTSSSIGPFSATIACNYTPNTFTSTATVWLEYRVLGTTQWTTAGSQDTGKSGYNQLSISRALTGLLALTTYEYRLNMTRSTVNDTSFQSTISNFTTLAATPTVTTTAATNIGPAVATLNGIVNPNASGSTTYAFVWGTTLGGPYPNRTAAQGPNSGSSNINYSQGISGLSPTTTYYYKAVATMGGTDYFGSEVSFTTAASAAQARIMPSIWQYERKYGQACDGSVQGALYFSVEVPSATNSDRFLSAAVPWNAGDVTVIKDGGAPANIGSLPTRVGTSSLFKCTLTATEMQANDIVVLIQDQDADTEWRDTALVIQTQIRVGQINVDATGLGGNNAGLNVTGVGTSAGAIVTGGATATGGSLPPDIQGVLSHNLVLRATASAGGASTVTIAGFGSATNSYYNNTICYILSGTGAGQARFVTGWDGTGKVLTVNRSWTVNPANGSVVLLFAVEDNLQIGYSELTSVPSPGDTAANKLQFLFQRFAFKRTQTVTTQTLYKSDSSTTMSTASVSDDGTTQTTGKNA